VGKKDFKAVAFRCAYYSLKNEGFFSDAKTNYPSHKEIYEILYSRAGINGKPHITELMDYLKIPYSKGICSANKKAKGKRIWINKPVVAKNVAIRNNLRKIPSIEFFASDEWKKARYKVLELHGATCQCCGRSRKAHGVVMHVDHIKPRSIRPDLALSIDNLQVLCEDCNMGKSNKFSTDWR
jgi:5-methylcytosine-specific restriction endonuclease McrA